VRFYEPPSEGKGTVILSTGIAPEPGGELIMLFERNSQQF